MPEVKTPPSSFSPASVYESPKFYAFSVKTTVIGLPLMTLASYAASIALMYFGDHFGLTEILSVGPIAERITDVATRSEASKYSYIGTLLVCVPSASFLAYLIVVRYFRDVVKAGYAKKLGQRGDYGIAIILVVMIAMIWFAFFMDLDIPQGRRLGMNRFFVWPSFPFFGSLSAFSAAYLFFAVTAGIYKMKSGIR